MLDFAITALLILLIIYLILTAVLLVVLPRRIVTPSWHSCHPGEPLTTRDIPLAWGRAITPADHHLPFSNLRIPTPQGYTLDAWYIPHASVPAPTSASAATSSTTTATIICVHGASRDRRAFLRHAVFLRREFNVVLFDCASHGASDVAPGPSYTLGPREAHDLAAVLRFVRGREPDTPISILATSQGAAASILATSYALAAGTPSTECNPSGERERLYSGIDEDKQNDSYTGNSGAFLDMPLPDAMVLENPFTSPHDLVKGVVAAVFRTMPLLRPFSWISYFVTTRTLAAIVPAQHVSMFGPKATAGTATPLVGNAHRGDSAIAAIGVIGSVAARIPMFLIHGTADRMVSPKQSELLFQVVMRASPSKGHELWIVKGAEHTLCYDAERSEFSRKVMRFFRSHLHLT